jgi:hypothetical protein
MRRPCCPLEKVPQPKVTDVTLNVDLYPDEPRVGDEGHLRRREQDRRADVGDPCLLGPGPRAASFLGTLLLGDLVMQSLEIDGARLTKEYEDLHYRIYTFDRPLEPGQKTEVRFRDPPAAARVQEQPTTRARSSATGRSSTTSRSRPWIGMSRFMILQDRPCAAIRPGAELRPPKLEDDSARAFNYFRHEPIGSTRKSRFPARRIKRSWPRASRGKPGRRRPADLALQDRVADQLLLLDSSPPGTRCERTSGGDVSLAVYYHPPHDISVDRMLRAMKASLDYYSTNFSPFQFRQMRIVEFPDYMNFAQAFPGTVPYSEAAGFIIDARDSSRVDGITYVTAHETGHQWWAHQVIGADMQGQTVLSETLASTRRSWSWSGCTGSRKSAGSSRAPSTAISADGPPIASVKCRSRGSRARRTSGTRRVAW